MQGMKSISEMRCLEFGALDPEQGDDWPSGQAQCRSLGASSMRGTNTLPRCLTLNAPHLGLEFEKLASSLEEFGIDVGRLIRRVWRIDPLRWWLLKLAIL